MPFFSLFCLAKGVSLPVVIGAQMFWSAFSFLSEIPTGVFADQYGQKLSMVLGYLVEATGIVFFILFPSTLDKMLFIINASLGIFYLVFAVLHHPVLLIGAFIVLRGFINEL